MGELPGARLELKQLYPGGILVWYSPNAYFSNFNVFLSLLFLLRFQKRVLQYWAKVVFGTLLILAPLTIQFIDLLRHFFLQNILSNAIVVPHREEGVHEKEDVGEEERHKRGRVRVRATAAITIQIIHWLTPTLAPSCKSHHNIP